MNQCRICSKEAFGTGGDTKIPLCKEHYVKTAQLLCYYYDKDDCPYEGTDDEWAVVKEMIEGS